MTEEPPLLRTEHLSREVRGHPIVEDINLTVQRGEVLAIIGPSGSGKSSLLRLLNRLDEPTRGTVYLEGIDYRTIPPRELRRRVGLVSQIPYLFPGTVADNLRFGPRQHGEELSDREIAELLARVGLPSYAERDVSELSVGEAQRISLARTLANRPQVLLLDEPTSALDEQSKGEVEALIKRIIREEHLTCLIVTHDPEQARRMARQALLLVAGRQVCLGPIEEVIRAQSVL